MSALLEVRNLRVGIAGRPAQEIVRGVSFVLKRGERLGLVGESGSGKSVTALSIARLIHTPLRVLGGEVYLEGVDLLRLSDRRMNRVRGGRIGLIYQDPMAALNPVQTVGTQIAEAIRLHSHMSRAAARARAIELLGDVGLPHAAQRVDSYPHELSGGLRQRALIAIAISADPELLLADEPTTALDVTTQARILDLLGELSATRGISVLLITHDLAVATEFCDTIQVMYAGRIVEQAAVGAFYERPLHPYTRALLQTEVNLETDISRPIPTIAGQPPLPGEFEGCCAFAPRCAVVEQVCREVRPDLVAIGNGTVACHVAAATAVVVNRRPLTP
ncbi:MAG: ABC transporter ATP-binding protein [Actinomycetota bacterium]|jgi:oligopeptide/dipeptide ABC transporter ATP-binding protein|nr:ABC transporter ATP-binding protein [Actinomycetota bacterium]